MHQKKSLPGVVGSLPEYPRQLNQNSRRTIEEKRQTVIHGIERYLKGEERAQCLERLDPKRNTPVIRVLYASQALPLFNGERYATIDPQCDRGALWSAIIDEIRSGTYDREIEEVASRISRSLEKRRQAALKAA